MSLSLLLILNNSHFCCCLSVPCEFCIMFVFTYLQSSQQKCGDQAFSVTSFQDRTTKDIPRQWKLRKKYNQSQKPTLEASWSVKFTTKFLKGTQKFMSIISLLIKLLKILVRVSLKFLSLESYLWLLAHREAGIESLELVNWHFHAAPKGFYWLIMQVEIRRHFACKELNIVWSMKAW